MKIVFALVGVVRFVWFEIPRFSGPMTPMRTFTKITSRSEGSKTTNNNNNHKKNHETTTDDDAHRDDFRRSVKPSSSSMTRGESEAKDLKMTLLSLLLLLE